MAVGSHRVTRGARIASATISTMAPSPSIARRSTRSFRQRSAFMRASCGISQLGGRGCRLPLPAPVLPEILFRRGAHVLLEQPRVRVEDRVHVAVRVARVLRDDLANAHVVAAIALANAHAEKDGDVEPKRELSLI